MAPGGRGTAARTTSEGPGSAPPLSLASPPVPGSPTAERPRSRWRDPRLALGVALVAVCALLGGQLLGGADDTTTVWSARVPLEAGQRVTPADLTARAVRFGDQADADHYLSARRPLPAGIELDRPVGRGELLPRAAVGPGLGGALTEVPLSVGTDQVPVTVHVGARVDVWATADAGAGSGRPRPATRAARVFADVPVLALPGTATSLGPTATRQVIVGVDAAQTRGLATALAALAGGDVVLTVRR